jgi:hypothetical protein
VDGETGQESYRNRGILVEIAIRQPQLAQADISLSIVEIMDRLSNIHEVSLLYPAPRGSNKPLVRTVLSEMELTQRDIFAAVGLERYQRA